STPGSCWLTWRRRRPRGWCFGDGMKHEAEADVRAAVGRVAAAPAAGSADVRGVPPGSAACYAGRAAVEGPKVRLPGGRERRVVAEQVGTPLPDVAVAVEEAEGVRRELAHRRGLFPVGPAGAFSAGVFSVEVGQGGGEFLAEEEGGSGAGPSGVLPLC